MAKTKSVAGRARARARGLLTSRYTIAIVLLIGLYLYAPALVRRLLLGAVLIAGAILLPVLLYVAFHRRRSNPDPD